MRSRRLDPDAIARTLERGMPSFADEVDAQLPKLQAHRFFIEKYHNGGWLIEPIRTLEGEWTRVGRERFPKLVRYLDEVLPECRLVCFSALLPGAEVLPHRGVDFGRALRIAARRADWPFERFDVYWSGRDYAVIRFHLCLESPTDDHAVLGLECEGRHIAWRTGACVYFDDSRLHRAWNRTDRPRTVLIVDLLKSELGL